MAKKIEAYNASYPVAFYEIGTVYAFYAQGSASGTSASDRYIQRFSSALINLKEQQTLNAIQPVKGGTANEPPVRKGGLTRYYAVVIDKSVTYIEIMFLNYDNGVESFLTRKYIVSGSCATDGKDIMVPSMHTYVSGVSCTTKTVGGITKIQNGSRSEKVGGITKADQTSTKTVNIGGITRMKK